MLVSHMWYFYKSRSSHVGGEATVRFFKTFENHQCIIYYLEFGFILKHSVLKLEKAFTQYLK